MISAEISRYSTLSANVSQSFVHISDARANASVPKSIRSLPRGGKDAQICRRHRHCFLDFVEKKVLLGKLLLSIRILIYVVICVKLALIELTARTRGAHRDSFEIQTFEQSDKSAKNLQDIVVLVE